MERNYIVLTTQAWLKVVKKGGEYELIGGNNEGGK